MGDGTRAENVIKPSHAYLTPGTFTASLTVKSASGSYSTDSVVINVLPINASNSTTIADAGDPEINRINLQAAIDAAARDDRASEIVVPPGFAANDPIRLPGRSSNNYVTIRSSGDLPANKRVTREDIGRMFYINARGVSEGHYNESIIVNGQSSHFRMIGAYIQRTGSFKNDVIAVDTSTSSRPSHIIFDRVVIDGNGTSTVRGFAPNGTYFSLLNSSILDISSLGFESKAIGSWLGGGPTAIVNNRLEAASINLLIGGSPVSSAAEILDGLEFRSNYVWKSPDWVVSDGVGKGYAVKNLFELKCGSNITVYGNIFENNYADGQAGEGILINGTDYDEWSTVRYVDFRNNKVLNSRAGFDVAGRQGNALPNPAPYASYIRFFNNLFVERAGRGDLALSPDYFELNHNTFIQSGGKNQWLAFDLGGANRPGVGLKVLNNLTFTGTYGSIFSSSGEGTAALNYGFSTWDVRGNVFEGADSMRYPAGNYFTSGIGQSGTDGAVPGADIPVLESATHAAAVGVL
jgi:hypothetical protein